MDDRVEWALNKAALWKEVKDKLQQSGSGLSGGQQQRLCIARGIAIKPEVLLLDEPCSALDPISTAKIEELIAELKNDYTVVIVTHNMQQAARCSDYTAYMYLGDLIELARRSRCSSNPSAKRPKTTLRAVSAEEHAMTEKHLSSQFDAELNRVSARVMELGGLVEAQLRTAVQALTSFSTEAVNQVVATEKRVNALEVEIDHDLSTIIARRQPTARDLRLLIAFSKATANLERMGDEAHKMARMVQSIIDSGTALRALPFGDLRVAAEMASELLRKTLDAFARLDTGAALSILKEDDRIDTEFDSFVRTLITYMMEDPRKISASLDLLFLAKAIERIGDHSKNIAEQVIYLVEGKDVRHQSVEQILSMLQTPPRP